MDMYTLKECRSAIRACEAEADKAESRAMRTYWSEARQLWERRARELEQNSLSLTRMQESIRNTQELEATCPEPISWGSDQHHCTKCGLTWDNNEEKPPCIL